jgi:hypothetical protein
LMTTSGSIVQQRRRSARAKVYLTMAFYPT